MWMEFSNSQFLSTTHKTCLTMPSSDIEDFVRGLDVDWDLAIRRKSRPAPPNCSGAVRAGWRF